MVNVNLDASDFTGGEEPTQERKSFGTGAECSLVLLTMKKDSEKGFPKSEGHIIIVDPIYHDNIRPNTKKSKLFTIEPSSGHRDGAQINAANRIQKPAANPTEKQKWDKPFILDAESQMTFTPFDTFPGAVFPVGHASGMVDKTPNIENEKTYKITSAIVGGQHCKSESTKKEGTWIDYVKAEITGVGESMRKFPARDEDHAFENFNLLERGIIQMNRAGFVIDTDFTTRLANLNQYDAGFLLRIGGSQKKRDNGECYPGQYVKGCFLGKKTIEFEPEAGVKIKVLNVGIRSDILTLVPGGKKKAAAVKEEEGLSPQAIADAEADGDGESKKRKREADDVDGGDDKDAIPIRFPGWEKFNILTMDKSHNIAIEKDLDLNVVDLKALSTFWRNAPFIDIIAHAVPYSSGELKKLDAFPDITKLTVSLKKYFVSPESISNVGIQVPDFLLPTVAAHFADKFEDKVELDKKAGEIKKVVESLVDNRGVAFIGKQPEAVISQLITMPNVKFAIIPPLWKIFASEKARAVLSTPSDDKIMDRLIAGGTGLDELYKAFVDKGGETGRKKGAIKTSATAFFDAFGKEYGLETPDGDHKSVWLLVAYREKATPEVVSYHTDALFERYVIPTAAALPSEKKAATNDDEDEDGDDS